MGHALLEAAGSLWSLFSVGMGFAIGVALTKKLAIAAGSALAAGQSWVQIKVASWSWYHTEVVSSGLAQAAGLPTSEAQAGVYLAANTAAALVGVAASIALQRAIHYRRAREEEELRRQEEHFRLLRETGSRFGVRSFYGQP